MPPKKRARKTVTFARLPRKRKRNFFDSSSSSSESSKPKPKPEPKPQPEPEPEAEAKRRETMTEPRARAARHKGQLNFGPEITSLLYAFGDCPEPLPETVRVLDEIVTDFIIETCHAAARSAAASRRQKIKVEDFKWAMRSDEMMLGRIRELMGMDKELKEARKQFSTEEGKVGLERGGRKRKFREGDELPEGL